MAEYYDGTKLLSMLDIHGNKPEIYMCTSNRSAGKTTFFNRLLVNKYLKEGEKFALIYRFDYELEDSAEKFFKEIKYLFFPDKELTSKRRSRGKYYELFMDNCSCGYAVALNNADYYKKNSHLFADVRRMLEDEFQSETNHYCQDEVNKLISIHTSFARGGGKQVRYLPVYMISNPITILNPYYVKMKISSRLREETKFLKGDGFVLEQGFNASASKAQKESAFNRAFADSDYIAYASEAVYLNDNKAFIDKPVGKCRYIATLKYENVEYGLREFTEDGYIYCDSRPDRSFPLKITTTTDDHNVNYVMLKRNDFFLNNMRYLFERGCFRFKDMMCKEAVLSALKY